MKHDANVIHDMLKSGKMTFIQLREDDQHTLARGMNTQERAQFFKALSDEDMQVFVHVLRPNERENMVPHLGEEHTRKMWHAYSEQSLSAIMDVALQYHDTSKSRNV